MSPGIRRWRPCGHHPAEVTVGRDHPVRGDDTDPAGNQARRYTRIGGRSIPGTDDQTGSRMLRVAERRVLSDRNRFAVRM
jgi:hypothetical protein